MSAHGIIPDPGYGGLVVTVLPPPAGVTNAYVPPDSFTVSTALTFYGANCSANRFDPQQLNAFQSEMLCLAATINPNGTWNAGSVCNLANAFSAFAAALAGSGGGVALAHAADYPGSVASDSSATTPAYVAAAITAAFTSPLAVTHAAAYPSSNDTLGATAAYISAAILAHLATSAAYPAAAGSNILSATPAYVAAAVAAATTTIEALIPGRSAAGAYPSASDTTYTTPAYVAAAVAAISVPARTNAAAYPSASDTTYSTPAYVAAAVAAISVPSRTNAAAYPSASDTTYATPAYVTAAIAAIGADTDVNTYAGLTDVSVASLQNNQIPVWNSGASKWENADAPYNLATFAAGTLGVSEIILLHVLPYAVEIPVGATNSQAVANTAATATPSITIKKNGSSIGSVAWAASGTVGAFTFASAISFASGDIITLVAPASADATLADIGITLAGFRL